MRGAGGGQGVEVDDRDESPLWHAKVLFACSTAVAAAVALAWMYFLR